VHMLCKLQQQRRSPSVLMSTSTPVVHFVRRSSVLCECAHTSYQRL
jgi:hypothetical protein